MERSSKYIEVQKIPRKQPKEADALTVLAEFCYHYPAYTLRAARRLPYQHIRVMLATARRLRAAHYHTLVQIAAAPHTEKGKGVTDLLAKFKDEING